MGDLTETQISHEEYRRKRKSTGEWKLLKTENIKLKTKNTGYKTQDRDTYPIQGCGGDESLSQLS